MDDVLKMDDIIIKVEGIMIATKLVKILGVKIKECEIVDIYMELQMLT